MKRSTPAICSFWCENRRKFSFNPNNTNTSANLFSSKSFNLTFLPSNQLGFLLISQTGQVDVFIESLLAGEAFQVFSFDLVESEDSIILSAFAFQRSNSKVFLLVESLNFWLLFEFSTLSQSPKLISKATKSGNKSSKFIWSEVKESLVQVEIDQNFVKLTFYNYLDFSIMSKIESSSFDSEIIETFTFSLRAPNYLFLNCKSGTVLILNLNGDLIKQISLAIGTGKDCSSSTTCPTATSSLMISPNGLVVGKLAIFDQFPLLSTCPIGEINPKSIFLHFVF